MTSIHNRRGCAGILERHLKHSPRRSRHADRGRLISLPREKRLLDILESEFDSGSTSNLFDNPGFDIMIATISWRQMHKTIIFCLNLARQLQTNNEQTRTQNRPTCWQLASEVDPHLHMVRAAPSPVAWDFDSPWITGPMTAHQSVAYVRHIILAPAANLCTPSAIVFLPIRAWIWRHIRRYPADTSTAAPFSRCISKTHTSGGERTLPAGTHSLWGVWNASTSFRWGSRRHGW